MSQPGAQLEAWHKAMSRTPLPRQGCFESDYPSTGWREVSCMTATPLLDLPARGPRLYTVGAGTDFSAHVSGLISSAIGSFPSVTGVTSESDSGGAANTYTLQLNTNFFSTSVCSGHAGCQGWQQFAYRNSGSNSQVWMEYWLANYGATCPATWASDNNGNCVKDSLATIVPVQTLANLANLSLTGTVVSGGTDTVMISTGSGHVSATGQDSVLNLAQGWNTAEYNIFGTGGGSQANFNSGSTIVVRISLVDGSPAAPTCPGNDNTGETNSLTLVNPCCSIGGTSPGIMFTESSAAGAKPQFCLDNSIVPVISLLLE